VRIVFFGSPEFAVPSLEVLAAAGHDIVLAVSQPAKPVGRKAEPKDPIVAEKAKAMGFAVFQPPSLEPDDVVARLGASRADVFVVVAYGKILPQRVLDLPRLGCVNVHGSLLPRWRGASPVQAALLAGDVESGVSIMRMDAGMDTGPVYAMRGTRIGEKESVEELGARIAVLGADALVEVLLCLESEYPVAGPGGGAPDSGRGAPDGESGVKQGRALSPSKQIFIPPVPQPRDSSAATYCKRITREDARVDWTRPAAVLVRRDRAFTPWPGLFTFRSKTRVKLASLSVAPNGPWMREGARNISTGVLPGTVLEAGERVVVACGEGEAVCVGRLQAEGRKELPAAAFVRGERVLPGEVWG
jgi:methionyl-tRNA formyltransferase